MKNILIIAILLQSNIYYSQSAFENKKGKIGFKDQKGKVIIDAKYEEISSRNFIDGIIGVKLNDKWGFIDEKENIIIPFLYDKVSYFVDGICQVVQNEKIGYIDLKNNIVIPIIYESACDFKNGINHVKKNGKVGFIDKTGKEIIPFIYEEALCHNPENHLASVFQNGKWGKIDTLGNVKIPFKYDGFQFTRYGITFTNIGGKQGQNLKDIPSGGKWGAINNEGVEIIPFKYDYIQFLNDSLIKVGLGGKWIKDDSKSIMKNIYSGGKWGIINKFSEVKTEIKFDELRYFSNGIIVFKFEGKWGALNESFNQVIEPIYDFLGDFNKEGYALVKQGKKSFYIDKNGNIIKR